MENEIWKNISGFGEKYRISNRGRVMNVKTNKLLKPSIHRLGYKYVRLYEKWDGYAKWFSIHRLVAFAFIPNPNNYPEVNHKDLNPSNNSVDNLEWCDHKYNSTYMNARKRCVETTKARDGYHNRKMTEEMKEHLRHHPRIVGNKHRAKKVYMFSWDGIFEKEFESAAEAQRVTGINARNISACCAGRLPHAGKKKWSHYYGD